MVKGFKTRPVRKALKIQGLLYLMPYYVYIIQSQWDESYYKGYSENPSLRLIHHNQKIVITLPAKLHEFWFM